jgi:serine/threonine protein kinase
MRIILTVTDGPHQGLEFTFDRHDTFLVGRSQHAHFQLPAKDRYFSRIHFMMEVNPPECRLIDMGSHNGTYVNGEQVLTADLKDGDQIRAGHTTLRVKVERDSDEISKVSFSSDPDSKILPVIPGYVLERKLGSGIMGITLLGHNEGGTTPVAIKLVQPGLPGTPEQIEDFLREVRCRAVLDHPHIARLHEASSCPHGLYVVSEYVPGISAAKIVSREGPLSIDRALRWMDQALQALHYAHAKHFIHHDLKPANLVVVQGKSRDTVKLLDFGLARSYQAAPFSGLSLTAAKLDLASYLPPETLFNFRDSNPLADQYSAAAVLYFLLTGAGILESAKTDKRRYTSLLRHTPILIQKRRPDVPARLADAVNKALSRTPSQRFASIAEFRQAILDVRSAK